MIGADARGVASMSSQEQYWPSTGSRPPRLGIPSCRACQRLMTVKQVSPVLFASGFDDVIYGCEKCGTEAKQTVKRA